MAAMLLAIDPGGKPQGGNKGATGWASWFSLYLKPDNWHFGEITGVDHHMPLWDLLDKTLNDSTIMGKELTIILEPFEFRKEERDRYKIDYTPAEYVGVVKSFVGTRQREGYSVSLAMSAASQGKGFWSDNKLKRVGLYHKSSKHIRDATRHLLRFRTFELGDRTLLQKLR